MFAQNRHQQTTEKPQVGLRSQPLERAEGFVRISLILGFLVVVAIEGLLLVRILIH